MTQKDKELLLEDLCPRLPYGVKVSCIFGDEYNEGCDYFIPTLACIDLRVLKCYFKECAWSMYIYDIRPYLRPMSSMTIEEINAILGMIGADYIDGDCVDFGEFLSEGSPVSFTKINRLVDWLNKNMFDYRCLIEKGLAIEAKAGMYECMNV